MSRGSGDTAGDDKKPEYPEYPEYPCAAGPTGNVFTTTNLPPKFSLLESTKRWKEGPNPEHCLLSSTHVFRHTHTHNEQF